MRKAFIILTGILFTLLCATCKQFTADIDGYLSYWSSEAYITDSTIKAVSQNDLNSIPSVPSAEDVSVTFKLKNPKSFSLDLPPEVDAAKNVIVFEHLTQAPVVGTDYTLTQSEDRQNLILTYKASFLQAHEWGTQDLSSTLSLYAVDGRPFKQIYTLKLKANTPPPNPGYTVAKTTGSPAYYVLCITIPDMDKRVSGGLLHKDLARIEVNGTPYTFSVNEAQTAFTKPEADVFITHSAVKKLNEPDTDDVPADSSWVLYYKTDVEVKDGAVKKDYTIKLIDERGLASGIVNASTKPNKAEPENINITKGTPSGGSGSDTDPTIIGTESSGAELTISSPTANTTVHCTCTDTSGGSVTRYNANPVIVPLPLNGAGEKQYKLEYYTDGEGFAATPIKTVYYKVAKGHTVTFNANGGTYQGGATVVSKAALYGTKISPPDPLPEKQGYGLTGWYKDKACSAGQAWNFATDTVTGDMTLYAQWTANNWTVRFNVDGGTGGTLKAKPEGGSESTTNTTGTVSVEHGKKVTFTADPDTGYEVEKWMVGGNEVSGHTSTSYELSAVTEAKTVTVKFKKVTTVKYTDDNAWKLLKEVVTIADNNAVITIEGEIRATTDSGNNGEIVINKNLTIKGKTGTGSDTLNAITLSRIFKVKNGTALTLENITLKNGGKIPAPDDGGGIYSEGTLTLKNTTIEDCSAANSGGGVYAGGGTFEMQGSSKITGCTASKGGGVYVSSGTFKMQNSATVTPIYAGSDPEGKNDVYLESGKTITVDGTLSNNPAACITPREYTAGHLYLTGSSVRSQYSKFIVTEQQRSDGYHVIWSIDVDGKLKKYQP